MAVAATAGFAATVMHSLFTDYVELAVKERKEAMKRKWKERLLCSAISLSMLVLTACGENDSIDAVGKGKEVSTLSEIR